MSQYTGLVLRAEPGAQSLLKGLLLLVDLMA